jgi:hypothetical protein
MFSQFKQFCWFFTIGCNPTSIACISVSEDEARQSILEFLTKIDELTKDYRIAKEKQDRVMVVKFRESFNYNEFGANLNIGCFCTPIYDFHLGMKIGFGDDDDQTLEDYIKTTPPKVSEFKSISIFSCLDG